MHGAVAQACTYSLRSGCAGPFNSVHWVVRVCQGQTGVVEITASRAVPLELYSDYRALGRVALRDGGRTIAVGVVTKLLQCS